VIDHSELAANACYWGFHPQTPGFLWQLGASLELNTPSGLCPIHDVIKRLKVALLSSYVALDRVLMASADM
jgi:hypothetical protein